MQRTSRIHRSALLIGLLGSVGAGLLPANSPAEPPAVVARWAAQDQLDPVAADSILFTGSSSIRRWEDLAQDFSGYKVVQRGFGGSQLFELNAVAPQIVLPYHPRAIVVWEGTNDIKFGRSGEQIAADFRTFVSLVHAKAPKTPIFYLSITPCPSNLAFTAQRKTANRLIKAYAETDKTLHFIDIASFFEGLDEAKFKSLYVDDTHLNRAGYKEWLRMVRPAIEAVVPPDKAYTANPLTLKGGEKLLFDFGPDNAGLDGDATRGADSRGNFWNNWHTTASAGLVNSGEHLANLVSSTGKNTGIRITITGGFQANGKRNGGLLAPDPALLGDLAVATATEDYFYSSADGKVGGGDDDLPGSLMLDGLNPALEYEFRLLGSREAPDKRTTRYDISGANKKTATLQTSGPGSGSKPDGLANDRKVTVISGIRPDKFGQVFLDVTLVEGAYAYLNAMEVIASSPVSSRDRADERAVASIRFPWHRDRPQVGPAAP